MTFTKISSVLIIVHTILIPSPLLAQNSIFPATNGKFCPSGSTSTGDGHCRQTTNNQNQYIPQLTGNCPSNTTSVGAGVCRANNNYQFTPSTNGQYCPSGTTTATSGYCRKTK